MQVGDTMPSGCASFLKNALLSHHLGSWPWSSMPVAFLLVSFWNAATTLLQNASLLDIPIRWNSGPLSTR